MKKTEVAKTINNNFKGFLKTHGFKYRAKDAVFIKKSEEGFQQITFSITDYAPKFWVNAFLSVRADAVQEIYNEYMPIADFAKAINATNAVSMDVIQTDFDERGIEVNDESELENALRTLESFIEKQGLEHLEKFSELSNLDVVINDKPSERCVYMTDKKERTFKGLIIASLTKNEKLNEIRAAYKETRNSFNEKYQMRFDKLIKQLDEK